MPPPKLPGNAPVPDVVRPIEIRLFHALWKEPHFSVLHALNGRLYQLVHFHEPLLLHHRLHRRAAAVVRPHVMGMRRDLHQKAHLFKLLHQGLPAVIAVHSGELPRILIHHCVIPYHHDLRKPMALPDLKVVRVMRRGDFHAACPKLLVHIGVRNHRDLPVRKRQRQRLSNDVLIPLIVWADRDRRVAKHRFRPRRGNLHKPPFLAYDRIVDVPKKAVLLLMLHLSVGNRGLAYRAPVDDPGAFVNIAFLV